MADPFSIAAGTVGLLDVCWRLCSYLKDLQAGAKKVDDEVVSLLREIEEFGAVADAIQKHHTESKATTSSEKESVDTKQINTYWRDLGPNIAGSKNILQNLEIQINIIIGKESSKEASSLVIKFDRLRKQLRKDSKEGEINKLRSQLKTYYSNLQLRLQLITLSQGHASQNILNEIIHKLKILQETKEASEAGIPPVSNVHFDPPRSVVKNYTGRTSVLNDVRHAFTAPLSPDQDPIQKRFVVYGLGGSGKTEFCCKYAELYRESYWGIFSINAVSDQLAEQAFQEIAKIGGVDGSVRAAKLWLSNCKNPWLLIIDNADDQRLDLQEYFPKGERGHILITTRVKSNRRFGTVGLQSLEFEGLKHDDASSLLLKTASTPEPWDASVRKLANSITRVLGYLPLALIHAGKAILNHLCKLEEYLIYHQIERRRVREARDLKGFRGGDNIYTNVYSSFEINFHGLQSRGTTEADDAVQLLQLFSFFHNENIRVDFLKKAATNPAEERNEQEKQKESDTDYKSTKANTSWSSLFKQYVLELGAYLYKERTPPVLPDFIRDNVAYDPDGTRVNVALFQLSQLSLISYNEINDSYSIHPVVHNWARERPEFHIIEQAVWCRAAITTLAQCILLPPLASSEYDEQLRRDLLPHIDYAREKEREFNLRTEHNRQQVKRAWLHGRKSVSRQEIGYMARFSRVYAQGGKWDEALRLQLEVKDFCMDWLGPNHDSTMMIKLALSAIYWQMARRDKAAELQEQVLSVCEASRGEKDKMTLKAIDTLGETRFLQGRYTESFQLHERAYKGMIPILGPGHQDTLKAAKNLGRGYASLWQLVQARVLLKRAVTGMTHNVYLGPTHLDTLFAMEDLAVSYVEDNEGDRESTLFELEEAHQLMTQVLERREQKLGKEHPLTLYGRLNLARVKATMGRLDEAEVDIRASILTAEGILDSQHLGILCAKLHLGKILLRCERYTQAEKMLLKVAESHRVQTGEHPDRCKALEVLAICYKTQGRYPEAIKRSEEAIHGLKVLKGDGHPYMERLQSQREELIGHRNARTPELSSSVEREEAALVQRAATFT